MSRSSRRNRTDCSIIDEEVPDFDMGSVGEKLRQERESQGRDLAQVAAETRIGSDYLAAIEADDLECLPGGFFTRSFIRQYARLLGVPDSEIEQDLSRLLTEEEFIRLLEQTA